MRWITKFADEQGSGINGESCAQANYKIKISIGIVTREWEGLLSTRAPINTCTVVDKACVRTPASTMIAPMNIVARRPSKSDTYGENGIP
jgi:hypothetical protein